MHRRMLVEVVRAVARRRLIALGLVLLGLSATEGVGVLMLLPLLQLVGVEGGGGAANRVSELLASSFGAVGLQPTLTAVLTLYIIVVTLQASLQRAQSVLSVGLEQDTVRAMRRRVYGAIVGVEWAFFTRQRSSDFVHVLTSEIDRAGGAAYFAVDVAVTAAIASVYFAIAFAMSPAVTGVVAALGVLLLLALRARVVAARRAGQQLTAAAGRLYQGITEHLGSMKTAMSYGVEDRHVRDFAQLAADVHATRVAAAGEYGRFRQLLALGSTAGLAVAVYVSLELLAIPTAELLVLLFVFARLMPRLTGLYEKVQTLAAQVPAFAAVSELEARCEAAARPPVTAAQGVTFEREIELRGVEFGYGDAERPAALRGIDLVLRAGETTAIVGSSGAGKSTVADLLMGLLRPTAGHVLIDGRPLDGEAVVSWREQIGYVPQETFLFHDTVRANLRWARPDATDQDLWRALTLAAAEEFVRALPAGLDTVLGDRGVLVSGGERQRLSLARALVRSPRMLILDEATSSLDSENEARIQNAIDGLHRSMTIVIITHRLSTIRHADVVHVMEQGHVAQTGSWRELAADRAGRFHALLSAQGLSDDPDVPAVERRPRRLMSVGQ